MRLFGLGINDGGGDGEGAGAYTVPYVAAGRLGDTDVVRAAAATVTAAARRILDHLDGAESTQDPRGIGKPPRRRDRPRSPGRPGGAVENKTHAIDWES